jgi:amino-acid N-acetyltransferase
MTDNEFKIDLFSSADKQAVLDLLGRAELPVEDLTDETMNNFVVAKGQDTAVIGVAGVEIFADNGLLRSLAVDSACRGKGLGTLLTRKIESLAWHRGIRTLYLLTLTAADFFSKIGYEMIQRDRVPESIQNTPEFKGLCPVSAVCLFKVLDSASA